MPIYEYRCSHCGRDQDILVRDESTNVICSQCGSKDMKKKLSVFAVGSTTGHDSTCCGQSDACCGGADGCGCGHQGR